MASRRKNGGESCGALSCFNSRLKCPGKSFYRFPKEAKRCKVWVKNTGRQDLLSRTSDRLHKGTVLCEDHFDPKQFRRPVTGSVRRRLTKDAVPTIFGIVQSSELQLSRKSRKMRCMTLEAGHIATGSTETEKGEEEAESQEGVTCAPPQFSPAASENEGLGRAEQGTLSEDVMDQGTEDSAQRPSTSLTNTMDKGTEDSIQKQSTDTMDQNIKCCRQGRSTSLTDSMDQGTENSAQGQSKTLTDITDQNTTESTEGQSTSVTKKLEPPWSMNEEPPEQPSAVHSPEQPMSDSKSGSRLSANTRHTCQRCSAAFMLSRSLKVHMETFHRKRQQSDSSGDNTDQTPSGQKTLSPPRTDDTSQDSVTSPGDFVIKLEPPWSMNEEPPDHPSAVHSPEQPMSSDGTSGSRLSVNRGHMCQCCFSVFALFSSLEIHMATFHGDTPRHDAFPVYSAHKRHGVDNDRGIKPESFGNNRNLKSLKGREEGLDENDNDRTNPVKKSSKLVSGVCSKVNTQVNRHKQLLNTGPKPHACDVCGKTFTRPRNLKKHKLIHSGDKPKLFACDLCSERFSASASLSSHKLTHSRQSFVCDACHKAFTQSSYMVIHTGHRSFMCDKCRGSYTFSSTLKKMSEDFWYETTRQGGKKPFS